MSWTERAGRWRAALLGLGLAATLAAAAGTGVRATRGAQTTADEPQYLLSAVSIAADGDLDIADELAAERWREFHEAPLPVQTKPLPGPGGPRHVSPHDPLLPLLLAAPVALGGWVGAKLALALVAGALAVQLAVTAARLGVDRGWALGVSAVFTLSAPLAVYGTQVYPELPAALVVLFAAAVLLRPGPLGRRAPWMVTAAVVALPWLALKYAPVAAALAAVVVARLWREGRRGDVAGVLGTLAAAGVTYAGVHLAVYTGITPYAAGDHFAGGQLTAVGSSPNYLGRSQRLVGLFVDRQFGLAAWQPAWLLVVPAVADLLRRRPPRWPALATPLAAGWLTAVFVALTMHGYWFPGRQTVVVLPLAVLAVAVWTQRWRPGRWLVAGLGAVGVYSYGWLLVEGLRRRITWAVDFFAVGDPWYRAWSSLLPVYVGPTTGTWVRHSVWLLTGAAVAVWAWRRAGDGSALGRRGPRPRARRRARA